MRCIYPRLAAIITSLVLLSACASFPTGKQTAGVTATLPLPDTLSAPISPTSQAAVSPQQPTELPPIISLQVPTRTLPPTSTPGQNPTAVPTQTASPTSSLPSLILLTPTLQPAGSRQPYSAVHIVQPGPGSRLTSPVQVEANAIPGADGSVTIQLIGEDGREIASETQRFATPQGQRVGFVASLEFKLAGVAEAARLQISTRDGRGRLQALESADILLLSGGIDELAPEPDPREHFILVRPAPNGIGRNGELPLTGYLSPVNEKPVLFELVDDRGDAFASASFLSIMGQALFQPFNGILKYSIQKPTWSRLVIRQVDMRIPGNAYLASQLVYLYP